MFVTKSVLKIDVASNLESNYESVNRYLHEQQQEYQFLLDNITSATFLDDFSRLRMIEEKLLNLDFGLNYPEIFEEDVPNAILNSCENDYLTIFYDQTDHTLLNEQRSLFYTIWPDVPNQMIWETPWEELVRESKEALVFLKAYYQELQEEGRTLLKRLSPQTIEEILPVILAIDAKYNLLFWFLKHDVKGSFRKEWEIYCIVEEQYKRIYQELTDTAKNLSRSKLLYSHMA